MTETLDQPQTTPAPADTGDGPRSLPPRDEGGRFTSSREAAPDSSTPTPDASPQDAGRGNSTQVLARDAGDDPAHRILRDLQAKRDRTATERTPSTHAEAGSTNHPGDSIPGQVPPTTAGTPSATGAAADTPAAPNAEAPKAPAQKLADFDDLDAGTFNLLKAEKSLPSPDRWKAMPDAERAAYIEMVKAERNQRNRQFNKQNNRQAGTPKTPTPAAERFSPETTDAEPTDTLDAGHPDAQGFSTGRSQAGQPDSINLPQGIQAHLDKLKAAYGEDSAEYAAFAQVSRELAEIRTQTSTLQQQREAERQQQQQERQVRAAEDQIAKALAAKGYPQLSDPENKEATRTKARTYWQWMRSQGVTLTAEQAWDHAADVLYSQENHERSRERSDTARTRSLAGTFDSPSKSPPPASSQAPSPQDEKLKLLTELQGLHAQGITGEAARQRVRVR